MEKIKQLAEDLRKIAFYDRKVVSEHLSAAKCTIPELKQLYIDYTGGDKCCLHGNKEQMLHSMIDFICGPSTWMSIMYGRSRENDTRWYLLSPDQKYHFCAAREIVFAECKGKKVPVEEQRNKIIDIIKHNNMYDENVVVFVNNAIS